MSTPISSRKAGAAPRTARKRTPVTLPHAPRQSFGYLVRSAYRMFDKVLASGLSHHEVLTAQWSVLRVLWHEEGLSQSEIAERMRVERASLTLLLNGMERAELITRTPDQLDRRKIRIFLTTKGRKSKRYLLPIGEAVNAKATRGFTAREVATLRELLERLVVNLDEEDA